MGAVIGFKDRSLDEMMNEFHRQFGIALDLDTKSHNARLKAASLLKDMRTRVEAGEAGEGIKWWEWFRENSVRSRKDAEKLLKIANSDDPEGAYKEENSKRRNEQHKTQPEVTAPCGDLDDSNENVTTANSWDDNKLDQRRLYRDALHLVDQMDDDTFAEFLTELKRRGLI
jgi:hypothetical protein